MHESQLKYRTIKILLLSVLVPVTFLSYGQNVNIPDANFKNALIAEGVDTDEDREISYAEAEAVTALDVRLKSISNVTGIEAFINLDSLYCGSNKIASLDVSGNNALIYLNCAGNMLSSLDISACTALEDLHCGFNKLTTLKGTSNSALKYLNCNENLLTALDISGCHALEIAYCGNNKLTNLDVDGCTALTHLYTENNNLTALDISTCIALTHIYCEKNKLAGLNASGCASLIHLTCDENLLTDLNVSGCNSLKELSCKNNLLYEMDISGCTALGHLYCGNNQLEDLDISNNTALISLFCEDNTLYNLDVSGNTALTAIYCNNNELTTLETSNCTVLKSLACGGNLLTNLDISKNLELFSYNVHYYGILDISNMPDLGEVCVWELPFPPADKIYDPDIQYFIAGSPNVYFKDCLSGISQEEIMETNVYPVPCKDILNIDYENLSYIVLYSADGRMILESAMKQVDISSLKDGIYFMKVFDDEGFAGSRKVLKINQE